MIRKTLELDWLLLTKRPENVRKMLPADRGDGWSNVLLGAPKEDEEHFDRCRPILRDVPAVVRFVSYEPALGSLALGDARPSRVICGDESGSGARYMEPAWGARSATNALPPASRSS